MLFKTFYFLIFIIYFTKSSESRDLGFDQRIRSDVIVTKYEQPKDEIDDEATSERPGVLRRTLLKFGQVASNIGTTLGKHSVKVTSAIEKICEIIKTIIPVISAVCGVGQFKFCAATEGVSGDFENAMHPNPGDLNIQD
ncbi:uncharacterized protein [Onthophagus taurus]|uniref:uncharacterized protein n=1 Tax=Onthophagus taurus TaxID=166361 RepID=UPI000C20B084|nr:uncharacterized protein LOC111428337 [Onthophagus taurus]